MVSSETLDRDDSVVLGLADIGPVDAMVGALVMDESDGTIGDELGLEVGLVFCSESLDDGDRAVVRVVDRLSVSEIVAEL